MANRINVKSLRESMGLSIDGLASKIGVSGRTVSRWENAHNDPSPLAVSRLRELQQQDSGVPRRRALAPFDLADSDPGGQIHDVNS
jgi:DNA-binding transcriptional regulator YiaG